MDHFDRGGFKLPGNVTILVCLGQYDHKDDIPRACVAPDTNINRYPSITRQPVTSINRAHQVIGAAALIPRMKGGIMFS
jgi:hypothetical protein